VSDFFWLAFAALVVLAAVQLATWTLEWLLEERRRRRTSPHRSAQRIRG